ncbi:SWIM zinc finger domain-containing protein [Kangiella sp. TOML190]|uniref:SWIM zinc finger family protein n=1 Tax=Kangiella sp. TOML190 TaxID=2931351 RepID=UPI00203EBE6A|nr:SWIM zinc finger family protein [Kangiella sp. TOML190]
MDLLEYKLGYQALVAGSANYRMKIEHTAKQLNGSCSCPASENFDFCKHCMAVALCLAQMQTEQLEQGAKLTPAQNELLQIEAFLQAQSVQTLSEALMEYIVKDRSERNRWLLKIALSGEFDAKAVKKRITAATRGRHIWEYAKVRAFFEPIEELSFHLLKLANSQADTEQVIKLIDYCCERIDLACDKVDDSGGFRLGAVELLGQAYEAALDKLKLSDEKLTAYIFDRLTHRNDIFYYSLELYQSLLNRNVLSKLRLLAQEKFAKTPKASYERNSFEQDWQAIRQYDNIKRLVEELEQFSGIN